MGEALPSTAACRLAPHFQYPQLGSLWVKHCDQAIHDLAERELSVSSARIVVGEAFANAQTYNTEAIFQYPQLGSLWVKHMTLLKASF